MDHFGASLTIGLVDVGERALLPNSNFHNILDDFSKPDLALLAKQTKKRRSEIVAGRTLAKHLICQKFNLPWRSVKMGLDLKRRPSCRFIKEAKDLMANRVISFNISHSNDLVGCALADFAVGFDLERVVPRIFLKRIARRYFSSAEFINWERTNFSVTYFYRIWTLKEAYLKKNSRSVWQIKQVPSFILQDFVLRKTHSHFLNLKFTITPNSDKKKDIYMLAVAADREFELVIAQKFWPNNINRGVLSGIAELKCG
ncbi:MAG: 4'-phosphopantetheinyl transferase superfamily protein [SAR324 cluster bacterium]|nr:4'-phosphopantetheinyl transferase superfamily protein [SAR324 cluster bacterium]